MNSYHAWKNDIDDCDGVVDDDCDGGVDDDDDGEATCEHADNLLLAVAQVCQQ